MRVQQCEPLIRRILRGEARSNPSANWLNPRASCVYESAFALRSKRWFVMTSRIVNMPNTTSRCFFKYGIVTYFSVVFFCCQHVERHHTRIINPAPIFEAGLHFWKFQQGLISLGLTVLLQEAWCVA